MALKALVVSAEDARGGAAIACSETVRAFQSYANFSVEYWVRRSFDGTSGAREVGSKYMPAVLSSHLQKVFLRLFSSGEPGYASAALIPWGITPLINTTDADIVNLHWMGNKGLSIREVGKIKKPVVWTLHDEWLFRGVWHYRTEDPSKPPTPSASRLESWFQGLKRHSLVRPERPIFAIAPSSWIQRRLGESELGPYTASTVIPYPIDTDYWQSSNQAISRKKFPADPDGFLALFVGDVRDPRKGFLSAMDAVEWANSSGSNLNPGPSWELAVAGKNRPQSATRRNRVLYLGNLDRVELKEAYGAADVVVVPSTADNLPQVALEAQAAGKPVIAPDVGGLSDIVVHEQTGFLVKPGKFAPQAGHYLALLAKDRNLQYGLGSRASERARKLWHPSVVARAHTDLFEFICFDQADRNRCG